MVECGRYNLFKILEKLKFTVCLHSWSVDLGPVVRGDLYTQSQQPENLKKKGGKNWKVKKKSGLNMFFQEISDNWIDRLCKQTNSGLCICADVLQHRVNL